MSIEVRNVTKHFGDFGALKDVSLEVKTGELVGLARAVGFGQDDVAADHRRPRDAGQRQRADPAQWRGCHRQPCRLPAGRFRFPALRPCSGT